ncbi:MAG: Uma2 family endonuclease [Bacteroidetes bacterium]|nr:Uma2 family endonuclease [Bacteroidota bacterium]
MVLTAAKKTEKRKQEVEYLTLVLPNGGFTDSQFFEFCQLNDNLRIERNSKGEIIIMPLTGGKTGQRNAELVIEFGIWNRQKKGGIVFDSSTGFKLPNGATYSPDLAWVKNERWQALTPKQQERHVPICPDFVMELLSSSQGVESLKAKMGEFMENGCNLGWLIDPYGRTTYVFRPKMTAEVVPFAQELFGGQVLEDFKIKLSEIF